MGKAHRSRKRREVKQEYQVRDGIDRRLNGIKEIFVPQPFEDRTWTGGRDRVDRVPVPEHVYLGLRRLKKQTGRSMNEHIYAALMMFMVCHRPYTSAGHKRGFFVDVSAPCARLLDRVCEYTMMKQHQVLTAAIEDYMYTNVAATNSETKSTLAMYMKAFTR